MMVWIVGWNHDTLKAEEEQFSIIFLAMHFCLPALLVLSGFTCLSCNCIHPSLFWDVNLYYNITFLNIKPEWCCYFTETQFVLLILFDISLWMWRFSNLHQNFIITENYCIWNHAVLSLQGRKYASLNMMDLKAELWVYRLQLWVGHILFLWCFVCCLAHAVISQE